METRQNTKYTMIRNEMREWIPDAIFDWRQRFFEALNSYLSGTGLDVEIINAQSFTIHPEGDQVQDIPVRDSIAIIQNNDTGMYSVIDCHDWIKPDDTKLIVQDTRCRKVLKCQYHKSYFKKQVYDKIVPWTYFDRYWPQNEDVLTSTRSIKPSINKLYFRGIIWGHRGDILDELIRRGIMNNDYSPIDFDQYHKECSEHLIMLSLSGLADVCHRDIEGFASGRCILRPTIQNMFHNNLIPDYHYINVDFGLQTNPVEAAEKIERRFNDVVNDRDFLNFVAKNAMDWYDGNVSIKNVLKFTASLLELEDYLN